MKKALLYVIPIFILLVLIIYILSRYISPPLPSSISIATAGEDGAYYQYAQVYKKQLKTQKVDLEVKTSAGSIDALNMLKNDEVDFAFMQSGTAEGMKGLKDIESVGALYYEPLWIFYRNSNPLNSIQETKGRIIAVGEKGSGTHALSLKILNANGVNESNSNFMSDTIESSIKSLKDGTVDVMFVTVSAQAKFIKEIMQMQGIKLFSFKRSYAYAKQFTYLSPIVLHEGSIDIAQNIPNQDITMLASTAVLVTKKSSPKKLIRMILSQIKDIHSKADMFSKENMFPSYANVELPINKYAKKYLQSGDSWLERTFPFWIANHIERIMIFLIPLLTLMIPLSKGLLPLYRWRIRSTIYKWYKLLHEINEKSYVIEEDQIPELVLELKNLKKEVTEHVDVPLSYMGEYYNLQLHIDNVLNRLDQ